MKKTEDELHWVPENRTCYSFFETAEQVPSLR